MSAESCACLHDGRGSLVAECQQHQEIREQRDELLAALQSVVENFGPWHDYGCPCDDTCACSAKPIHDAVNAAIAKAEEVA